jgi:hypothetical protein
MDHEENIDDERFQAQVAALKAAEEAVPDREPVVVSGLRGTRTFVLYQPIKVDSRMLTRITIRPPTGGDLDDWASGKVASSRAMLAHLTGLHPSVIRGLDSIDMEIAYQMFWDMVPDWLRDTAANSDTSA